MNEFEDVEYEIGCRSYEVYRTDNFDFGSVLGPVRHFGYYWKGLVLKEKNQTVNITRTSEIKN